MPKKQIKSPEPLKGKFLRTHEGRVSTNQDRPLFGLEYIDATYSLKACTQLEKAAFSDTLAKLGQLTWQEIMNANRHGVGCEIIPQEQIHGSIPQHVTPDVRMLAFRFCGKAPMVGYREDRVFYVIWLDRNFTLYNHG